MSVFVLAWINLLLFVNFGNCNNKHMICKEVDTVCDDSTNIGIPARRLHEPPRLRGPPGKHGLKGEPANVDYERIEERVNEQTRKMEMRIDKMNEQIQNRTKEKDSETREMQMQIDELNEQIQNLTKEKDSETREMKMRIDELNEQIQNLTKEKDSASIETVDTEIKICVGETHDNDTCYWKDVYARTDIAFAEASKICTDKNSKLANIYSEEQYNMLMNYIRTDLDIRTDGRVFVWTGMRKQYKNPGAILSDARTAPFTHPTGAASFWNTADPRRTHVALYAHQDASQPDQGMVATLTLDELHGALCQSP